MGSTQRSFGLDKIDVLQRTDVFRDLSLDILKKIAARTATRHLDREQVLFSEHDEVAGMFVVAEGELRSIRQNVHGREQVLSTERAGAILALAPLFNGGKYYSTMIADTAAEVIYLDRNALRGLCSEHPELFWNVARVFAHKIRHLAELVENLALRNVEQRVAQHLFGVAQERGLLKDNGCTVELKLTRSQMASRLGSTREVVSRTFTHLQHCNLIRMHGPRLVTILDMSALKDFAGLEREAEKPDVVSEVPSDVA